MGRVAYLLAGACGFAVATALAACSGGDSSHGAPDGSTAADATSGSEASTGSDAAGGDATVKSDGADAQGSPPDDGAASDGALDSSAGDGGASDAADAQDSSAAPTVVATLGDVPASLALSGANLYVTVASSTSLTGGVVQTVPKTAMGATLDGGAITTLASGLRQPRAIAVSGGTVYWHGSEVATNGDSFFAVPTTGGTVSDITPSGATTYTRTVIANSTLYALDIHSGSVLAYPLMGAEAGAGQVLYAGTGTTLTGIDSDGTSVFFVVNISPFAGGTNEEDISQVSVNGGAATALVRDAGNGSAYEYLVNDATTIYWTAQKGIYSLPKTGGTPTLLASHAFGEIVQIALDGNNIYVLESFALSRLPKSGGTPVTLASVTSTASGDAYLASLGNVVALAFDDAYVYWLYESHGQILKIAK